MEGLSLENDCRSEKRLNFSHKRVERSFKFRLLHSPYYSKGTLLFLLFGISKEALNQKGRYGYYSGT